MAVFHWQARTRQGQSQSGEIEAGDRNAAMMTLRRQGYLDIRVRKKPTSIQVRPATISDKEITIFFRQLSTMINAGLPLVQCFQLAERGSGNPKMTQLLRDIRERIEGGAPLAQTLREFPKYFDRLTCSLVEAGEQGGILDSILLRLCVYKEKARSLKSKIKSALVYPAAVIVVAFVVTAVLMIFVIPVFGRMFADFGVQLPAPTRLAIAISDAFVRFWYMVLIVPVLLVAGLRRLYRTSAGRYRIHHLLLRLPVLGDVLRKAAVARFCRTFSTLLAAGVPIMDGLETVAETAGNMVVEEAAREARQSISQGQTLAAPLERSGVFPLMVTQMVGIGEETGNLEEMLAKIASFYEEEVDFAVNNMTALMEPLIMAFLGVVIGSLVISMYLPIFKMASVI